MGDAALSSAEAAGRFLLASVGWGAGLVAGLALTGLGIYDMATGAKVLDDSLSAAHDRWIRPLTGWNIDWEDYPDTGVNPGR